MIYPKFLKKGDTIGICAPSYSIESTDTSYDLSISNLKNEGYKIVETANVHSDVVPCVDAKIRANEFNELNSRKDIDFIWSASGGNFLNEVLEFIDDKAFYNNIKNNSTKWFAGYSDPTSLLYYITTKFDIATMYGRNAGSFDMHELHSSLKDSFEILKGNLVKQDSFEKFERISFEEKKSKDDGAYVLNQDDVWKTLGKNVDISGRLIGGCIDCLLYMIGTKFDYTKEFVSRYKNDGIIWYFDNFALKSEDLYFTLWNMKNAGWFEGAKGFVFGRTLFEGTTMDLSYEDAIIRALGKDMPIILDADIGHVKPTFNLINGAVGHFKASNGKGSLEMQLK